MKKIGKNSFSFGSTDPLENRAVVFNIYTKESTDSFITNGLKLMMVNNSDQQVTITGIEIVLCGSDS